MMPVKYEPFFIESGVSIHNPKYGAWWNGKPGLKNNHQSMAKKYNNEWGAWWEKKNGYASTRSITWKRTQMHLKYRKYYQYGK